MVVALGFFKLELIIDGSRETFIELPGNIAANREFCLGKNHSEAIFEASQKHKN